MRKAKNNISYIAPNHCPPVEGIPAHKAILVICFVQRVHNRLFMFGLHLPNERLPGLLPAADGVCHVENIAEPRPFAVRVNEGDPL